RRFVENDTAKSIWIGAPGTLRRKARRNESAGKSNGERQKHCLVPSAAKIANESDRVKKQIKKDATEPVQRRECNQDHVILRNAQAQVEMRLSCSVSGRPPGRCHVRAQAVTSTAALTGALEASNS